MNTPRVLMIFIDGLGIGEDDPRRNPLANHADLWPADGRPPGRPGLRWKPVDACLGVDGLPQSATGQTALLTGVNVAELIGRHLQGFPSRRLIEVLKECSIFVRLKRCGLKATFANAYRHPEDIKPASRLSVTSHALKACGESFRSVEQIKQGDALYHDFTNRELGKKGYDVPPFTPQQAGEVLAKIASRYDFTLYEHFLTDVLAHRGDGGAIVEQVNKLAIFIRTVLDRVGGSGITVVITSDHGNVEDISVKTHTKNPVPLLWAGPPDLLVEPLPDDIAGMTPWVLRLLNCGSEIS